MFTVNAAQSALLSRLTKLRSSAFGLDLHLGATFARDAAAGWKNDGMRGLASPCYALSQAVLNVPGGHDVFAAARDLAVALAAAESAVS